jgi:hypothetical protein
VHGTVTGGVILVADRFDVSNEAYVFDGTGFITVPSPFARGSDEFSLAIWLSPSAVNDGAWHGFAGSHAAGTRGPCLWVNWGSGDFIDTPKDFGLLYETRTVQFGDGTRFSGVIDSWFEANVYVHTVWTAGAGSHNGKGAWFGSSNTFYKNGAVAPGGTVAAGDRIDRTDLYFIGKVDNFFSGTIDEVSFYPMALSASDVEFLYFHGEITTDITTTQPVRQPMIDMGDGRYTVAVPARAAPAHAADSLAIFFSDDESVFRTGYDGGGTNIGWEQLRRVQYGTAHCDLATTHTVADPTSGASCVCADGFEPDTTTATSDVVIVSSSVAELRCHKPQCSFGHYSDGSVCRRCPPWAICPGGPLASSLLTSCSAGQQPDSDGLNCVACPSGRATTGGALCMPCGLNHEPADMGTHCVCTFGHYNSSAVAGGQTMHASAFGKHEVQCISQDLQTAAKPATAQCVPCGNLQCATCVGTDGELLTQPDWAAIQDAPFNIFRCPLPEACLGGDDGCAQGYEGVLCAVCSRGYDRIGRSCTLCTESGTTAAVTVGVIMVVAIIVWVGWMRRSSSRHGSAEGLQSRLTADNPVHNTGVGYIQEDGTAADKPARQRSLSALFRVLYQPGRILVGFFQVVTQIGSVLHFTFPPRVQW